MSSSWALQPLGQLCDVLDSKRRPVTKRDRVAGPYPYYGATGIQDYVAEWIFDEPLVLVGEDGAKWGSGDSSAFPIEGKTWVNNHAHVLRPHRDKILDKWLIFYLNHSDLTHFVSGMTVPKLNQENLRRIPVPVPPLPEQQRIVGILDQAFEGIAKAKANAERNLANAKELYQGRLFAVFGSKNEGWNTSNLRNLINVQSGFAFRSSDYTEDGHFLVRIGNVQSGRISNKNPKYVRLDRKTYKFSLNEGDIVTSLTGDIGRVAVISEPDTPAALNQRVARIIPIRDSGVIRNFLLLYLMSDHFRISLEKLGHGAAQLNVSPSSIYELEMSFPCEYEQIEIVENMNELKTQIDSLSTTLESQISSLDELQASILRQAFSGNL